MSNVYEKISVKDIGTGKTIIIDLPTDCVGDEKVLIKNKVLEKMGLENFTLSNSPDSNVPSNCYYIQTDSNMENNDVLTCGICMQPFGNGNNSNVGCTRNWIFEWKCGHHKLFCTECIILHKKTECKNYGSLGIKCPICRGMI